MKARVLIAFSSPVYGELKVGDIIQNVRAQSADLWVKHGMIEDATKPAKKTTANNTAEIERIRAKLTALGVRFTWNAGLANLKGKLAAAGGDEKNPT